MQIIIELIEHGDSGKLEVKLRAEGVGQPVTLRLVDHVVNQVHEAMESFSRNESAHMVSITRDNPLHGTQVPDNENPD